MDPLAMLPEIVLFVGGLACLLGGSFTPRRSQWRLRLLAAIALLAATVAALVGASPRTAFDGAFAVDTATTTARVVASLSTLLILGIAGDDISGSDRESDTYALLLFATTGALVLAGAHDLLVLAVGFLLASIPLYALVGLARTSRAAEAALKTYLLGALFGILLLAGVTLLYGVGGTTAYPRLAASLADAPRSVVVAAAVGILGGLMFKAGGVPAHFWVPDAAQGASGVAAAFVTTVPKVGALVAILRLVDALPGGTGWGVLVGVLAVLSMTSGEPRSIRAGRSQAAARLVDGQPGRVSSSCRWRSPADRRWRRPAMLFYLVAYAVTNVTAFAVTTALPDARTLGDYVGLGRAHPVLGAALVVALLGLVGTPPTGVFVGKLLAATAAWDGSMAWLTVLLLVNSLVSLFYYLRWIAPVIRPAPSRAGPAPLVDRRSPSRGRARRSVVGILAGPLWGALGAALLP